MSVTKLVFLPPFFHCTYGNFQIDNALIVQSTE